MSSTATPEPEPRQQRTIRRKRHDDSSRTAPRRKRSKIAEDAFVAREGGEGYENAAPLMNGHAGMNGSARLTNGTALSSLDGEFVVRGGKKATVKRVGRADSGQVVLTQNANYAVKSLPSTPRALKRAGVEMRGYLAVGAGLALAVTRESAHVWEYGSLAPDARAKVFDLPFPAREDEPVPFGALVTGAASADTGLLLVSAASGRIVFHESIERAASMGLFQERQPGVEGTIAGMFSGEQVAAIASAESAGFIITLDSGRIAHLTLRDMQGKPRVQAQFLRAVDQTKTSFFGSIKGVLGAGAWKMDTAAVHARPLGPRGQVQVVAATEQADVKIWDIDWSGRSEYRGSIPFGPQLAADLRAWLPAETQGHAEQLSMMDFAFVDGAYGSKGTEIATVGAEKPLDMLMLLRVGPAGQQVYFLAEISLVGNDSRIKQTIAVTAYQRRTASTAHPKLVLPKPGHTAYVVFEDAVVVVATSPIDTADPEAQLHDASYIEPEPFQDAVYLRNDKYAIAGLEADESRSGQASCIGFVQGAGLVRISANDASSDSDMSRISVKSKIEQAVFYGMLQDNILDLARHGLRFENVQDVEEAALEISNEVLTSETSFITLPPTSIEANLAKRAQALHALISHLRSSYPPLSRKTMYKLLWNAEKIAAGQHLWTAFEKHRGDASKEKKRRSTLMHEVCEMLQEFAPYALPDNATKDDQVCSMFVSRLSYLDKMLPWARTIVADVGNEGHKSSEVMLRLVSEADDIWIGTLEAAFKFRVDNAQIYDIPPDSMPEGVLEDAADYRELPELWTSTGTILKEVIEMTRLAREIALTAYESESSNSAELHAKKIAVEIPQLVQLSCLVYEERINWTRSRGTPKYDNQADQLTAAYHGERSDQIRQLVPVGQLDHALRLAEKYKDMQTLTKICIAESQYMLEHLGTSDADGKAVIEASLAENNQRVDRYFRRFGDEWAEAFFGLGFSGEQAGNMLTEGQNRWGKYLKRYLQADKSRAKLCWINDVISSKDFGHASKSLQHAAKQEDEGLWCKKVELSMAKLSMLAAKEAAVSGGDLHAAAFKDNIPEILGSELQLVDIQDRLYHHVLPEIFGSLDADAELQLAMDRFGRNSQHLTMLHQLLEQGLAKLLQHQSLSLDELIDVLTLIDTVQTSNPDTDLSGEESYLALCALNAFAPELPQERFETLLRTIWQRVYEASKWDVLNAGASKRARSETEDLLADTPLFNTLNSGMQNGLFDSNKDGNYIRILPPIDCLGAGCSPATWAHRFPTELVEALVLDERLQDKKLQGFVKAARLSAWFEDVRVLAKENWERVNQEDLERSRAREALLGREKMVWRNAKMAGEKRERARAIKAEEEDVTGVSYGRDEEDGEGDVVMA